MFMQDLVSGEPATIDGIVSKNSLTGDDLSHVALSLENTIEVGLGMISAGITPNFTFSTGFQFDKNVREGVLLQFHYGLTRLAL